MKMTKIRKKAQDKLRRKYGYSTNDDYGRGTILYKADEEVHQSAYGYDYVNDLNIYMDGNISWHPDSQIRFGISKYRDDGVNAPEGQRYIELGTNEISITLEELDLIHTIAHQMSEENDWQGQIKRLRQKARMK